MNSSPFEPSARSGSPDNPARFSGWILDVVPETDTTNRLAARLPAWHAVRADIQTAGRGRTGRAWTSDPGGLWLSAVVPCPGPRDRWARLPLAVGWALLATLGTLGVSELRLRWPNDLLVGQRKLAGILLERHTADTAVVGIGVNVTNHPERAAPELRGTTIRLVDLVDLKNRGIDDIASLVLQAVAHAHDFLARDDFAPIASDLNAAWEAAPRTVELVLAGDAPPARGVFTGIDSAGRLLLRRPDGSAVAYDPPQVALLREICPRTPEYPPYHYALPMKPVRFVNTVLRDGHQSLAATRMSTAQMLPAAPILDEMGFAGLETWGGATIDSCLRFLGENPFDRLRALKKAAPKTPQLMLLRGQNIVQYTSFPDDVVEAFVRANAAAGQDIFRIFDALNDTRNLATAIKTVKACGKHARGEICYTTSPVHTIEAFVKMGVELRELGCDSIGIKDMSGVITPRVAHELVTQLRQKVGLPIALHTHDTAGLGASAYLAAIDAGVDIVETSISPFANGTAQPDTLRMLALLEGHPRCPSYDTKKLAELRDYFTGVYKELGKFTSPDNERVDSDTLIYQVPGGMLSNFRNQLKEQNMSDKFAEVMAEIPRVRAALGWIPLVTPTSQIVGTQAMLNVKFGRWKTIAPAAADIALNKYGRPPGVVDPELLKLIKERTGQTPIDGRPADALAPRMPKLREELAAKKLPTDDEACVLHAMFPQEFAKLHAPKPATPPAPAEVVAKPAAPSPASAPAKPVGPGTRYRLTIGGQTTEVAVEEI